MHADAFDPRKLSQVRALAANDRDLRLVDLVETQHVAAHPFTSLSPRLGALRAAPPIRGLTEVLFPQDETR